MGQTRNLRDGEITLKDGTGTPLTVVLTLEQGDMSWTDRRNYVKVLDRGVLDHVRAGDQEPVVLSFSVKIDRVSEPTSPVTLYNALRKMGAAASWLSVGQTHEPYALLVQFRMLDPAGGADHEIITFNKFFPEEVTMDEGEEFNTVSASGFAYITSPAFS
mgnify:CR=1 FL=1